MFAWSSYKASKVDLNLICHHLNVNLSVLPKKQPPRRLSKEHSDAVKEEVNKLKQKVGHTQMSFLDAFQGYHQIPFALNDQEKTSFVTLTRNYHYKVMPFSLKNTGSTYQRMMTRTFEPQLSKNIEVYIDDMVVKNKVVSEHMLLSAPLV